MRPRGCRLATGLLLSALSLVPWSAAGAGPAVFRFPLFYAPESLDPVRDSSISVNHIAVQVCDGLVAFDDNLRVVPGLAESWTVSREGTLYTFHLRKGVRFHDGAALTPKDVSESLVRIFRPGGTAVPAMLLDRIAGARECREGRAEGVSGIRVLPNGDITIELVEPYAPFLSTLAMPLTRVLQGGRPAGGRSLIGTGPFRLKAWEGETIVLVANTDHFRGRPALDEVRFIFYPSGDVDGAFKDFAEGRLDGCPIPGTVESDALLGQGYQVLERSGLSLLFYGMNAALPPLDNPDVRRALALGFDIVRHVRVDLGGPYIPASQILPPGMPGYTPENAVLKYDPGEAARLLARAGYPGGRGLPELTIASASQSDFARRELGFFAGDMEALGVRVRTVFVAGWDEFTAGLKEGRYPMYRYALYADVPDPDDFIAPLFESVSPMNYSRFSDQEVDGLLKQARGEEDTGRRLAIYRRVEKAVLERASVIPLLHISTRVAFQKGVRGMDLPATGTTYLPLHRVTVVR